MAHAHVATRFISCYFICCLFSQEIPRIVLECQHRLESMPCLFCTCEEGKGGSMWRGRKQIRVLKLSSSSPHSDHPFLCVACTTTWGHWAVLTSNHKVWDPSNFEHNKGNHWRMPVELPRSVEYSLPNIPCLGSCVTGVFVCARVCVCVCVFLLAGVCSWPKRDPPHKKPNVYR